MHISLGERWEKFVEKSVEDGQYGSASEVVQEGLRLVEQRAAKLAILRREIEEAIAEGGDVSDEELEAALEEKAADLAKQGF